MVPSKTRSFRLFTGERLRSIPDSLATDSLYRILLLTSLEIVLLY